MRIIPRRLGPKINLTLLLFMLLLGGAVATLVFFGFRQTQDNATKQSQQGLEAQARDALLYNAQVQAYVGESQFAASGAAGQDAARYMIDLKKRGGSVPWDSSKLTRAPDGRLFDASTLRTSDVLVPAGVAPPDAERDLADSAALDAVFATLLDSSQRGREANFGAVAMSYISTNGVTRSYPPASQNALPSVPTRDPNLMQEAGPDANPARKTVWSSPVAAPGGSGTLITAVTPVYEDNVFRGVVTVDLSLQRLIDQINLVKPTPSGFAFYMDDAGAIYHTQAYDTVTAAMNDPVNAAFARMLAAMRRRESGVNRVDLGGREMFVAYAPVGDVGGVFALAAPLDEVTAQAGAVHASIQHQGNRTLLFVLAALGAFFVASIAGAAWLNGRLVLRPIGALVRGTRAVAGGDFDTQIPVTTHDEFGALAESFNSMTRQVASRRDELRAEVAERERIADALRRSEELYRTLARNVPNGAVMIFDHDLRVTLADGSGLAAGGVTKEAIEGRTITDLFSPRLVRELEPRYRAALRGEQGSFEVSMRGRTYHVFSLPLLDERGEILGGMAMTQDVTDRKLAEAALRNERDLNEAIVGSAGALVCLLDREGRFVRFNRACEEMTGFAAAEVLGRRFWDVVIPPDQAGELEGVFGSLASGPFPHHYENHWITKDRRRRLISWTNNALFAEDGSVSYFVCTGIDRTEERQAEALVREREEQYRSVFESTTDGLIISNAAAEIIEVNPAMCAMHGYTREEFLALPPRAFIDPAYHAKREEYVAGIEERGEYRTRSRNVRKDGSTFPVEVYGTQFMYRGAPHLLGVVRDITAQVEVEEELERRVEDRTHELTTLLDVAGNVASTLELEPLLHVVLSQVKQVIAYDLATFHLRDDDELAIVAVDTPDARDVEALSGARVRIIEGDPLWETMRRGVAVNIDDVLADTPMERSRRAAIRGRIRPTGTPVRSWLGVPLAHKDRIIGMLALASAQPAFFSERDAQLATAIASQAAFAVENARLFDEEAARTHELETLLDASRAVASTIELEPLLRVILREVRKVAPYDRASLMLREGDDFVTTLIDMPDAQEAVTHGRFRFSVGGDPPLWLRLRDGEPVIIDDTRGESPAAADYRAAVGRRFDTTFAANRSWLGVPLRLQDRVIAVLAISKEEPGFYGEREAQLASAIARQAAFAVDNARLFEQAERRTRELAALLDVSRHVSSTLELTSLGERILREAASVVAFDRSTFVLADGHELEVVAVHAADGDPDESLTQQIGERYPIGGPPLVWDPLLRGEPVIVDDTHADTPLAQEYRRAVGPRHTARSQGRSWMAVPLMVEGKLNGIMFMTKRTPGFFARHDAELASAIATHAAIGIENARLYERAERRTQELSALLDVSRSIASTLDLKTLLRDLLARVAAVVEYERSAFMLLEDDVMRIVEVRTTGDAAGEYVSRQVGIVFRPEQAGMLWDVVRSGRPMIIDDVLGDSEPAVAYRTMVGRRNLERMGVRAWLGVPLEAKGRVVGMMTIAHGRPGAFAERDAEIVGAIASQAAVGVDNAQLFERLERQARELSTLLDVARHVGSTLEVRPLARSILEETARVVAHDRAAFMLVDGDETRIVAVRSATRERDGALVSDIDTAPSAVPPELWEPLRAGRHVIIDDVTADVPLAAAFRAAAGAGYLDEVAVRSWLAVPVLSKDRLNGVIMLAKGEAAAFAPRDAELAAAIASQAAVGVENARLFEQTEQRRRELAALLDVARHVGSTLDFGRLATLVLEEAARVVDFDRSAFMLIEDGEAVVRQVYNAHGAPDESLRVQVGQRFPLHDAPALWQPLGEGRPVIIDDVRDGSPLSLSYQTLRRDADPEVNPVRSWMAVPLLAQGRMIGILGMTKLRPHFFTLADADLAAALASQAAAGVANARLFEQTQQRTRELSTVLHVSHAVASTLQLRELACLILDELREAIEYTGASLIVREDNDLVITESRGPRAEEAAIGMRFSIDLPGGWWQRLSAGTPISIDNVRGDTPDARAYRTLLGGDIELAPFEYVRSWLAVPLVAQDRVAGVLTMSRDTPGYFNDEHARLALAIADQAALALENARLYERVQTTAALEERQRLARELHDSVSQALYGIGLGARTAKAMLERDATRAKEPIEYVLSLAEAGLTEMRALIFELRPESLQAEGLVAALEKQVSATRARYGIAVDADLGDEPEASLDVKEAVYRIAQEALHNTVKHAHAQHVELRLATADGVIRLDVADDGQGFDADGDFPGHLGLTSMRERVARVRGTLDIRSAPGEGTRIRALIPAR